MFDPVPLALPALPPVSSPGRTNRQAARDSKRIRLRAAATPLVHFFIASSFIITQQLLFIPSILSQTGTDRVSYYKRQKRLSLPVKNKKLSLSVKKQKDCLFLAKNYYLRMIIPPVTRLVFRLKKII
jgi:hypothetical protein